MLAITAEQNHSRMGQKDLPSQNAGDKLNNQGQGPAGTEAQEA
jgi:hypothetical protein